MSQPRLGLSVVAHTIDAPNIANGSSPSVATRCAFRFARLSEFAQSPLSEYSNRSESDAGRSSHAVTRLSCRAVHIRTAMLGGGSGLSSTSAGPAGRSTTGAAGRSATAAAGSTTAGAGSTAGAAGAGAAGIGPEDPTGCRCSGHWRAGAGIAGPPLFVREGLLRRRALCGVQLLRESEQVGHDVVDDPVRRRLVGLVGTGSARRAERVQHDGQALGAVRRPRVARGQHLHLPGDPAQRPLRDVRPVALPPGGLLPGHVLPLVSNRRHRSGTGWSSCPAPDSNGLPRPTGGCRPLLTCVRTPWRRGRGWWRPSRGGRAATGQAVWLADGFWLDGFSISSFTTRRKDDVAKLSGLETRPTSPRRVLSTELLLGRPSAASSPRNLPASPARRREPNRRAIFD